MQQEANQITSHQDGPVVPTCASCGPDQIDESGYVVTRLDAMTIFEGWGQGPVLADFVGLVG